MKTNAELQKDVQDAIKWEPLLNAAEIGVIAEDGVITLTGIVDSYAKKSEAEEAAKSVAGVKAVVEKLEVKIKGIGKKTDAEIANEILNAMSLSLGVPDNKVKIEVEDGWITLEGDLEWNYQKEAANRIVNNVAGVKGVSNYIKIKSETNDSVEKTDIERALARNWSINDKDIRVHVRDNIVKLEGVVHSFYQKDEAGRIAWNAPGVLSVDNELVIE